MKTADRFFGDPTFEVSAEAGEAIRKLLDWSDLTFGAFRGLWPCGSNAMGISFNVVESSLTESQLSYIKTLVGARSYTVADNVMDSFSLTLWWQS